jgi:CxxC motif-containing protein (DUF1111 family)
MRMAAGTGSQILAACVVVAAMAALPGITTGAGAAGPVPADAAAERPGGDTTVFADGRNAFSFPAANLTDAERTRFAIGNSFFRRNWVEAPASTQARDGLGPHFIARSCGGCHVQDGRGAPPGPVAKGGGKPGREVPVPGQPVALLLRLSIPGTDGHGAPLSDPVYGDQFNNAAVTGVRPEGEITIKWTAMRGRFADGTSYTLHEPRYGFRALGYGPMAAEVKVSPRLAPQLIGAGLLEAIPESEIVGNAEAQANAGSKIRGKPNRVWDAFAGRTMIGRFGWKANVATLAHQTGAAFVGDIGITSTQFPSEPCTSAQSDCLDAPRGNQGKGVEIDDATFDNIVFYQATLAPPARRRANDPQVRRGETLFGDAGCAQCHRPSYITGTGLPTSTSSPALSGQKIFPYTDLLLHDMGPGLADGRPDFLASGSQWKTPPLWGVGLIRAVNGHQRLLHDGRADGVMEAILWHGGEAEASRARVLMMTRAERDALVKFVDSL